MASIPVPVRVPAVAQRFEWRTVLRHRAPLRAMHWINLLCMLVLVGSVLRTAILGEDHSVLGPFIAVTTIFALDKALAVISARSPGFNRLMEGVPSLLARHGRCEPGALRRHDIAEQAFHTALRAHGLRDVAQVEEARLEPNGKISVIKRGGQESG